MLTLALTCNYVSSGMYTQTGVSDEKGLREILTFGSLTLDAGQSGCIKIGATQYSVEPQEVIFRPKSIPGGAAMCQAMVMSESNERCLRKEKEIKHGVGTWRECAEAGNKKSEAWKYTCDDAREHDKLSVTDCGSWSYLLTSWVDTCSVSTMGCIPAKGAWPVIISWFCLSSEYRSLVELVTYPVEKVKAAFYINETKVQESFNFTATISSSQLSLMDSTYRIRVQGRNRTYYRSLPISLGDASDLCALTVSNSTGKMSPNFMISKLGSCPMNVKGVWPTFNKQSAMTLLPFVDSVTGCEIGIEKVRCPVKQPTHVQVVIRENKNFTGVFTDCDPSVLGYKTSEFACPSPNYFVVSGPCRPIVTSPDCSTQIVSLNENSVAYSVVNYDKEFCTFNITGLRTNLVQKASFRPKLCYQNPNTPLDTAVSDPAKSKVESWKWKWPTLGGILGLIMIVIIVFVVLYCIGKLSCCCLATLRSTPRFVHQQEMLQADGRIQTDSLRSFTINVNTTNCVSDRKGATRGGRSRSSRSPSPSSYSY